MARAGQAHWVSRSGESLSPSFQDQLPSYISEEGWSNYSRNPPGWLIQGAADDQEADGVTDSIQPLLGAVLVQGLTPSFDKNRLPVHNVVVGPARQTDGPIRLPDYIAEIRHESTSRESAILSYFGPGTQVGRPY